MTGVTPMQATGTSRLGVTSSPPLYVAALRLAGHEVEHRALELGEPLGGYDVLLMGLASPLSWAANFIYAGIDAISRAVSEGCALGFYLDDWRFRQIVSNVRTVRRLTTRITRHVFEKRPGYTWAREHLDVIDRVMWALDERPWPPTIICAFDWGDRTAFFDTLHGLQPDHTLFLDPSPLVRTRPSTVYPHEVRHERWLSAALGHYNDWTEGLALEWPVVTLGGKANPKVKETEAVEWYGALAGNLSQPYDHVGSGWWRVRFVHSALGQSVLVADPREVAQLGEAFQVSGRGVEKLPAATREAIAREQAEEVLSRVWTEDRLIKEADAAVRHVADYWRERL